MEVNLRFSLAKNANKLEILAHDIGYAARPAVRPPVNKKSEILQKVNGVNSLLCCEKKGSRKCGARAIHVFFDG